MTRQIRHSLRALLRSRPDGMTVAELVEAIDGKYESVRHSLTLMPDAYIDRWLPRSGAPAAVWCVVHVPANCPKPKSTGMTPEEKREYHRAYSNAAYKKKAAEKKQQEQERRAPKLTEIRGPWPYEVRA